MHERVRSASAARWAKQDYEAHAHSQYSIKEQSYFNLNGVGECTSASAARPQRARSASTARPRSALARSALAARCGAARLCILNDTTTIFAYICRIGECTSASAERLGTNIA